MLQAVTYLHLIPPSPNCANLAPQTLNHKGKPNCLFRMLRGSHASPRSFKQTQSTCAQRRRQFHASAGHQPGDMQAQTRRKHAENKAKTRRRRAAAGRAHGSPMKKPK